MRKGTQLYQKPGSPLIQGHSKGERQFWREWLLGLVAASLIAFVTLIVYDLDPDSTFGFSDLMRVLRSTLLLVPGIALGAGFGITFARGFGWVRQWQSAAVFGLLVGGIVGGLLQVLL